MAYHGATDLSESISSNYGNSGSCQRSLLLVL